MNCMVPGATHDEEHDEFTGRLSSMSKLTERVYLGSPVWMQKLGVHAFGWYWRHRRLGQHLSGISANI